MSVPVSRWGNSLAVRLPKGIVERAGLQEGDRVSIDLEEGAVVLRRAKPKYTLEELLEGVDSQSCHDEIELGPAVGLEDP